MQELVMYMHAFVFLFGISICLKDDKHVRIELKCDITKIFKSLFYSIIYFYERSWNKNNTP